MSKRVTIETLAEWLKAREKVVILGHINPDGDTTGSSLAVWHALRALGKRAVVCLPDGIAGLYDFLPGAGEVIPTGEPLPFMPETAFSVDVSDPPRLGEAGLKLFDACPHRGMLDHHETNTGFGDVYALDGEAAAVGELATTLIEAMGVKLTKAIAECLFVAISTDCGQFSYINTRPQTFTAAAKCVEAGINVENITARLYRTRTLPRTRLLGAVLDGLQISRDGRMAWAFLTEAMLQRCSATREDNEGIVNYLREIAGVDFAVLVEERGPKTKLSMRSSTALNSAEAVAIPLGGGGHAGACGATVDLPMRAALEKALALAAAALGAKL